LPSGKYIEKYKNKCNERWQRVSITLPNKAREHVRHSNSKITKEIYLYLRKNIKEQLKRDIEKM
jgi:hypothetical protein